MAELAKTHFSVSIADTNLNRDALAAKDWATNEGGVRNADLIILPWHDLETTKEAVFPQGTSDVFKYLRTAGVGDVELIVLPSDYKEIAMHGKAWRLPTLFISFFAFPIFTNILANKLSELLPGFEHDDTVHLQMVIERPHSKCLSIKYEGPASRLAETVARESERCFEEAPSKK